MTRKANKSEGCPRLSIITVCRNEENNIRRTAESVVAQTCSDFEWIVKDGASTDGTMAVLSEYQSRMAHFVSVADGGVYDAMNQAVLLARGEWFLFLNGGDMLAGPDVVANILPLLGDRNNEVVSGSHLCVWPDGRSPLRKEHTGTLGIDHFYRRTINHQSAFIGRRVFERFGPYDVSFRLLADYDFFARAVWGGTVVRCIPSLVAKYDMTGMSATMKGSKIMRRERRRIRRHYRLSYRIQRFFGDFYTLCGEIVAGIWRGDSA